MSTDAGHFAVLGLARVGAAWFRDLSRWATAGSVPVEFTKCVSVGEVRALLASGRAWSAVLVDAGLPALDRDLVDDARRRGVAVLAVGEARRRDLAAIGVAATLTEPVSADALVATLRGHAPSLTSVVDAPPELVTAARPPAVWRGRLVAVTGGGGTGRSVVAMAIAQALAADARLEGQVVLADLALDASQAALHHAGDVVPGLQELVDAHRTGTVDPDGLRSLTWAVDGRGYRLVLGLRRHRDWTTLRPRAVAAAMASLTGCARLVVADVDPDLEGEDECGSVDVEERNLLARTVLPRADLVVVTALPGVAGTHRLARVVSGLARGGVEPARVLPVVNRAPRSGRARAELAAAVALLTAEATGPGGIAAASPVFVPERRGLEEAVRDAGPLPRSFAVPLGSAVLAALQRREARPAPDTGPVPGAVPIRPGSRSGSRSGW
jgi:hypothetical protein